MLKSSLSVNQEPVMTIMPEMPRLFWHQLVVLGNGFDLECGLKSRFSDFMAERLTKMEPDNFAFETWITFLQDARLTVWDFILRDKYDQNWFDIEQAIAELVYDISGASNRRSRIARLLLAKINSFPFQSVGMTYIKNGRRFLEKDSQEAFFGDISRVYHARYQSREVEQIDAFDVTNFLKEELTLFENEFANYLIGETNGNQSYVQKCNSFLSRIDEDEKPGNDEYETETGILNFNYTDPFFIRPYDISIGSKVNIHGRIDSQIIFGIDGKECMENELALPFTKTYRIALMEPSLATSLVYSGSANGVTEGTALIKFYGHSLGPADYSYFQSLFDSIDLYGGQTKLIFYYKPSFNDDSLGEEENPAKVKMVQKVSNLLNAYGHTLDNEDHGKNLMHKLLLEGRLSIRTVPDW